MSKEDRAQAEDISMSFGEIYTEWAGYVDRGDGRLVKIQTHTMSAFMTPGFAKLFDRFGPNPDTGGLAILADLILADEDDVDMRGLTLLPRVFKGIPVYYRPCHELLVH